MNDTLKYYQENVDTFVAGTVNVDFGITADRFLQHLSPGASILDFGCGAGRDTKFFLDRGYRVDAMDGSPNLCAFASKFTGIAVQCILFKDLDVKERYDGIWACASILHVSKKELPSVFEKMLSALKDNGVIYTSFKYGDFEGIRNGRYFSDFTQKSFSEFMEAFPAVRIIDEWVSTDVRPGREDEKWLNLILKK